jgi:hypothetical protein
MNDTGRARLPVAPMDELGEISARLEAVPFPVLASQDSCIGVQCEPSGTPFLSVF